MNITRHWLSLIEVSVKVIALDEARCSVKYNFARSMQSCFDSSEPPDDGFAVGLAVGFAVGFRVAFGVAVGFAVGFGVALAVAVGFGVGTAVGMGVGETHAFSTRLPYGYVTVPTCRILS